MIDIDKLEALARDGSIYENGVLHRFEYEATPRNVLALIADNRALRAALLGRQEVIGRLEMELAKERCDTVQAVNRMRSKCMDIVAESELPLSLMRDIDATEIMRQSAADSGEVRDTGGKGEL